LQSLLEFAERRRPGFGVLAHPPVVDKPDRDGVEEVQLLPATPPGHHQARLLQLLQVLHYPEAGHRKAILEGTQGLPVLAEQFVEQAAPGRVGQGPEYLVHALSIGDQMVTCQDGRSRAILVSKPAITCKRYQNISWTHSGRAVLACSRDLHG